MRLEVCRPMDEQLLIKVLLDKLRVRESPVRLGSLIAKVASEKNLNLNDPEDKTLAWSTIADGVIGQLLQTQGCTPSSWPDTPKDQGVVDFGGYVSSPWV